MSRSKDKIIRAFGNPKYEWRTIRGVAKETGVTQEDVKSYLTTHGDDIVKSSAHNKRGEQLYTTREHYRTSAGVLSRLSSALKNRGG